MFWLIGLLTILDLDEDALRLIDAGCKQTIYTGLREGNSNVLLGGSSADFYYERIAISGISQGHQDQSNLGSNAKDPRHSRVIWTVVGGSISVKEMESATNLLFVSLIS